MEERNICCWLRGRNVGFSRGLDVLEEQPKQLSEIKGKVISDYQNYLEEKWLDEQK